MPSRTITPLLLAVVLLACGAADKDKAADKKDASQKAEKPACMHCGATCGLAPICVCEQGTKKKPKVEFEVTCEPMCVAVSGSKPWPFGRCHDRVGCTTCCEEPCRCPGRVRECKKLKKETTDEEVPTIKRKVAYVCARCAGGPGASCTGNRGVDRCDHRLAGWWTDLTWWWPRKPAD